MLWLPFARCDVPIGDRVGHDGLLKEPIEQQPPGARCAAVEPERELVQVRVELVWLYRSLVSA